MFDHLYLPLLILDDIAIGIFGFVLDTVVIEPLDGIRVGEAQERSCGDLEVGVELPDEGAGGFILKEAIDRFTDL